VYRLCTCSISVMSEAKYGDHKEVFDSSSGLTKMQNISCKNECVLVEKARCIRHDLIDALLTISVTCFDGFKFEEMTMPRSRIDISDSSAASFMT
jgi:hypothetical protein